MSKKFRDDDWSPSQFMIFATQQTEELEREIYNIDGQIQILSQEVFRDDGVGSRLIAKTEEANRDGAQPRETFEQLNHAPQRLGPLRGNPLFSAETREHAQERAKELAVHLEARGDLKLTLRRYEDLYQRAAEAERFSPDSQRQVLPQLRDQRAYSDVTRETRALEFRDRLASLGHENRQPSPDLRPSPFTAQGDADRKDTTELSPTQASAHGRDWWQSSDRQGAEPRDHGPTEPSRANDDWWRGTEAEREIEPDREPDRDR